MTQRTNPADDLQLGRTLQRGAVAGMVGAMAMAMFAMIASVTYQHHGFFTPLFHISALTGSPQAMMTSVAKAMNGQRFWFTPGAALAGLAIHMMTGPAFGMMFALVARRVPRRSLVGVGALYGVGVFAVSSFIALPVAGSIAGSGDVISHMARMVGYPTFALEHAMFGMALGVLMSVTAGAKSVVGAETARRSSAVGA